MRLRSPMKNARGLGSAKSGTGHWWWQRVTAVALIPLGLWFVISALCLAQLGYADALAWVGEPVNAVLLVLMLAAMFYHSSLGVQVVIEDYVHTKWLEVTTLLISQSLHILLAAAAIFAVLRIALGGAH